MSTTFEDKAHETGEPALNERVSNKRALDVETKGTATTAPINTPSKARMGAESEDNARFEQAGTVNWGQVNFSAQILRHLELSSVLRVFGAGIMLIAIGIFLFQHWDAGSDLMRYSLLLGQTVILSLLGFATSRFMQEPKSARVFLALGLVSSAASFTILGALLYSTVQWDAVSVAYPGFAYWRLDSTSQALGWIAGSAVLLIPMTYIGYLTLARPAAKQLSILFVVNCMVVMLPVRDPAVAAVLAAATGIMSFWVLARLRHHVTALRTGEGRVAKLITLLPVAIVAGRCGYIYAASTISVASLGLLAYITARQMAINSKANSALQRFLEVASLLPALITAAASADFVLGLVGDKWVDEIGVAALSVVLIAGLVDLARRSGRDGLVYARGAALVGLLTGIVELAINPSMGTALVCAASSGAVAFYAQSAGFAFLYRVSLVSMLAALVCHIFYVIEAFDLGGWMVLAVLGISAIVLAAAIERHGEKLKLMWSSALRIPVAD